jgi:GTP-binding protein
VTRDRISYEALWNGKSFTVVDTGGWDPKAAGLGAAITRQAEYAMKTADVIVFVVDSQVGATDTDSGRRAHPAAQRPPVILGGQQGRRRAQRGQRRRAVVAGLGEPQPVSALHGRASGDLLDLVLDALPEAPREQPRRAARDGWPWSAAQRGQVQPAQPAGQGRASVVDSVAGTTVDPVDSIVPSAARSGGSSTPPGLRRKVNTASGTEYYASLRTEAAIQAARSPSSCWPPTR